MSDELLVMLALTVSSKKRGTIECQPETPHHTPTFNEGNGCTWKIRGFSALHILAINISIDIEPSTVCKIN
jgi:hypothetical protein